MGKEDLKKQQFYLSLFHFQLSCTHRILQGLHNQALRISDGSIKIKNYILHYSYIILQKFRMWFKYGLGASALYLSLRSVTVGSGRIDCD
jgi:hypothetical protein